MSEYQRFISYMYEYRGNNRFANCGYARIDNRNQLLKLEIHMKISSQSTEEPIHIYGCFQRDGQLYGVELGQHVPALGMVNWRAQCSSLGLSGTDISFSDLEGLILTDQSPLSYCSIWNDQSIRPMDMIPYPSPESEMISEDEQEPENHENNMPDVVSDTALSREGSALSPEGNMEQSEPSPDSSSDFSVKTNAPQENTAKFTEGNTSQMTEVSVPEISRSASNAAPSNESPEHNSGEPTQNLPDPPEVNSGAPIQNLSEPSAPNTPNDSAGPASSVLVANMPRTSPTLVEKIMAQEYQTPKPESFSKSPSPDDADNTVGTNPSTPSRWERLTSRYPRSDAFSEGELKNCVRVEPRDFPRLRREGWNIAGNRFILHCFQRNAHCLIGRIGDTEQYVFAVPGIYDNQERFMANMFGFPCFKANNPNAPLTNGQKGYWYRALH